MSQQGVATMETKRATLLKNVGSIAALLLLSCAIFMIAEAGHPNTSAYGAGDVTMLGK